MSQSVSSTSRRRRAWTPMKAVVAAFAVLATVVPVLVFATAQPASAAGAVSLSKSTGIAAAGETLTVNGSGFDSSGAKGIYVQFCKQVGTSGTAAGRPSGANCSGAQQWISQTAPPASAAWTGSGTFATTIAAASSWGTVDCRAAGTVCGVVTRNDHTEPGVYDQDTFTPVTFAADPIVPAPVVVPSKTANLTAAGETLTIEGSGFDSTRGIYVMFCRQVGTSGTAAGRPSGDNCSAAQKWISQTAPPASATWTGTGTFSTTLDVAATFKSIDCRAAGTTCGIVTRNDHTNPGVYDQDSFTPITFAADVPVEPTGPSVTVTPTTGLDGAGDTVTVAGTGFPEGQGVYVRFCQAPTGTSGTAAGRPAAAVCDVPADLWVTPDPPAAGPPANLVDGAFSVTLDVAGRFAGESSVVECMVADACGVAIRRDHVGGATDYALDSYTGVSFDPTSTPPVVDEPEEPTLNDITLSLNKTTDVADGETLTATGTGFVPEQGVYLQYCEKPTGQAGTAAGRATRCFPGQDGTHTVWVTPIPANGELTSPVVVEKSFELTGGEVVDCSTAGACGVFVRRDHNGGATDYSQDGFVPIAFGDGTAPPAAEATLASDQTTDLDPEGDTVPVVGEDFRPGVDYVVTLCDADDLLSCDYDQAETVTATSTAAPASVVAALGLAPRAAGDPGSFAVDLDVRAAFDDVDCLAAGSSCVISTFAVSLSEASDEVQLPVSFAARAVTPITSPVTEPTATTPDTTPVAIDPGTTATGTLPRTGSSVLPTAVAGLATALLGAGLVVASRRRTAQA